MLYSSKEDIKELNTALNVFLASNNKTVSDLARELSKKEDKEITPNWIWQRLNNRAKVEHDFVEGLAKLINPTARLDRAGKVFFIAIRR